MPEQETVYSNEIKPLADDKGRSEAYLPAPCVQSHASNIMPLSNGDLLCVWFAGTQEGIADISVYLSRLVKGSNQWSATEKLSDDPARSEQNPVLFELPDGKLWLFWTAQISGNQDTAFIRRRVSLDKGHTWGPVDVLFDKPGTFVRQPVTVLPCGDWLLPVFYCRGEQGKKWVGDNDCSAVMRSKDQGQTWTEYEVPGSVGCVHMNIEQLPDGTLVAVYRSRWADYIYLSRSTDNGLSWSEPQPTSLPNNNSSIQLTLLKSGNLAMVFNNMSADGCLERRLSLYDDIEDDEQVASVEEKTTAGPNGRTAFWGAPRAPMTVALSEDGGKTWPYIRDIETGDGYCMTNNSKEQLNREYSYPSIKQTPDEKIHVTFTYFRQTIKYVQIDENWIKGL